MLLLYVLAHWDRLVHTKWNTTFVNYARVCLPFHVNMAAVKKSIGYCVCFRRLGETFGKYAYQVFL